MSQLDVAPGPVLRSPKAPLLPYRTRFAPTRRCLIFGLAVFAIVLLIILIVVLSKRNEETPIVISYTFRLITYNDVYEISTRQPSVQDPLLQRGGAANVAGYVQRARAVQPRTLVLLAGDTISPSLMTQFFNGSQTIRAHNAIGLDYACLGNHEFDLGLEVLRARLRESEFAWLNANVYEADNVTLLADTTPNAIVDYGFVKVGIFGLMYQASYIDPKEAVIQDPFLAATAQIAELRARGANFVIALTHQFFQDACQVAGLPGINLVVTGHDHIMEAGLCGVPTVVATSDWQDLWDISIDYGRPGGNLANVSDSSQVPLITIQNVPVSNMMTPNSQVAALVKQYEDQMNEQIKEVAGSTLVPLDVTTTTVRQREAPVANFVTDYLRLQWRPLGSPLEVALLNGGGFRSNMIYPVGNLTVANILSIFPFSNVMPVIRLTGKELRLGLEECFSKTEFPQVSGIYYAVDTSKPFGSRIAKLNWAQGHANFTANATVLDDDWFLLTTNDFILNLLSSWSHVRTNMSRIVISDDEAPLLSELAILAVKQNSPISPSLDGRIDRVGPI